MLKIKLYKDVILNETYQNVFSLGKKDNKSILERYLDLRASYYFECPYAYYENTGELIIDYDLINDNVINNIYEYNYMRIEEYNENNEFRLRRYCFIKNISIKNGCVYLEYNEDIWSSYSDKIKGMTESFIKSSRVRSYPNFELNIISLPEEYKSNKEPKINSMLYSQYEDRLMNIYVQIQYYTLDSQGNPTQRYNMLCKVGWKYENTYAYNYSFTEIEDCLRELIYGISAWKFKEENGQTEYAYEIGNIYIVPSKFLINTLLDKNGIYQGTNKVFELVGLAPSIMNVAYTNTFQNDYKNVAIGTLNTMLSVINIGKENKFSILYSANTYEFSIKLSFQNQLVDITDDYIIDAPYQSLRSEQVSQLKLSRDFKLFNNSYQKKQSEISAAQNITGGLLNIGFSVGSFAMGNIAGGIKGITNAVDSGFNAASSFVNADKLEKEKEFINSPIYSTTNGIFSNSFNLLNSEYGIIMLTIDSVNDDYVKKTINNLGYNIYEYINDYSILKIEDINYFENLGINYNVISFKTSNVYGSFPRMIAQILNIIFETGVKIWFNENMMEDNYVV